MRTSAIDGKLTSVLKANTVARESAWPLFEGWVGIYNGGESRAQERPFSLRLVIHCWSGYFQVMFWKPYKVWQFGDVAGLLLSRDGWRSNWPHCARFVQLPLGHLGSTLQTSSGRHLLSFEQILCFSLCPQMQGFETTDVLCFLLKKRFFPWGLIVARRVKWQKELGVLKLRSMCGAPEAYQVSIRNRLFLFSGH